MLFEVASRTTEQAKEEAMKLLKSGAISLDKGNERHAFKRKWRELESTDSEEPQGTRMYFILTCVFCRFWKKRKIKSL